MVLSKSKLKRKKQEEAAAALAPPPNSDATPSDNVAKGDSPALLLSKKKSRPKSTNLNFDGKDRTVLDARANRDTDLYAVPDAPEDATTLQDEVVKKSKRRKSAPEVLSQEAPTEVEDSCIKVRNVEFSASASDAISTVNGVNQAIEPWMESKRSKKKKLTDRWGKKLEILAASSEEHFADPSAPHNVSGLEKVDPKKVMVGGMPYYVSEDDIHEFFKECGTITELDCMTFPDTGRFKGIAFITFRTEDAAIKALALDGADLGGRFLKIEICKIRPKEPAKRDLYKDSPKKIAGSLSAYIGNLSWDISEKELRIFFKGCKIDSIRFAENKDTGEFRGFGHIDFVDDKSLEAAMKLDQKPVLGRPLKIAYSVPQKDKILGIRGGPKSVSTKKGCYTCGDEAHMSYNCSKKPLYY